MKSNKMNHDSNADEQYTFTPSQIMSLITSTIIGVGVLTLPRTVTATSHQSGWISVFIGGLISGLIIWFILKIGQMFPKHNIISISHRLLSSKGNFVIGKLLTLPIVLIFIAFWFLTTAGVARTFGEVVVTAVLIKTPLEVIVASMLIVAAVMVLCDMEVMARVNEALLPILIIPVLFIALFSFQSSNFLRLLPLLTTDWHGLVQGMFAAAFAFQGYEIIALYTSNMDIRSKKTTRAAIFGIVIPMVIYALIVIAGITSFGHEELQRLMWPTLELVKTTEMPGLILERLESAFLGVWVAAVFTTVANLYFTACLAAKYVFSLRTHRYIAIAMLPVLYYAGMWPDNVHQLFDYLDIIAYVGFYITLLSPIVLIMVALVRREREVFPEEEKQ